MKMKWMAALAVACLCGGSGLQASAPSLYWDFDNSDGQTMATFDGLVKPGPGAVNQIDLKIQQNNGRGGSSRNSFLFGRDDPTTGTNVNPSNCNAYGGCVAGTAETAPEHYVAGVRGNAYHFQGGLHTNYDNSARGNLLDPNQDPEIADPNQLLKDIFSYRDQGRLRAVNLVSTAADGQVLSYAFWINVQKATSTQDSLRFGSGSSHVIGRGTGSPTFGGVVELRDGDGNGNTLDYKIRVRSDPVIADTSYVFQANTWQHFVVEYDLSGAGNSGTAKVYINGGPLAGGSVETFTGLGNATIQGPFRINGVAHPGASQREGGDFYLDDLAIFKLKLTEEQVRDIYQNGVPEPSSLALAGLGMLGLLSRRRAR